MFLVHEAIPSVAMEHPAECNCNTCKAADGDKEARDKIVEEYRRRRENNE